MSANAKRRMAWLTLVAVLCLGAGILIAQDHGSAASSSNPQLAQQEAAEAPAQSGNSNAVTGESAAGPNGGPEEEEENAQFKYSPVVKWFARHLGLDPRVMYWISVLINFALLVLFFYILLKSKLPQMFRARTDAIQKGIKEAQAASADAARRLSDIEARLGKLDSEVAEIRATAEHEAAAEEERIRQAAEEDKRKVVQAAEAEIAAIARNARRELKGFAASLAVDLAARQIRVDENADHALVRAFVGQLGKDGK